MKYTKFIIALLVIIGMLTYTSCANQEKPIQTEETSKTLIEIESHLSYCIIYDKDTKVIYYRGNSSEGGICPLYNADGSLKLYSGGNNND